MIIFYAAIGGVSMFQTAGLCMFAAGLMQLSVCDWWVSSFKVWKKTSLWRQTWWTAACWLSPRHALRFLPCAFSPFSLSLSLSPCPNGGGVLSSRLCRALLRPLTSIVVRSYEMSKFMWPVWGDIFSAPAVYLHSTSDSDILVLLSPAIWYL